MRSKVIADEAVRAVIRKRKRRARRRAVKIVCGILFAFAAGVFVGIHHRVIRAWLRGEPLPELPENHPFRGVCHK